MGIIGSLVAYKENFGLGGVAPQLCREVYIYRADGSNTLKWKDPQDSYVGGVLVSSWALTRLVRKSGSAPTSPFDGDTILVNTVRDKYAPSTDGYVDTIANAGTYYYALFPKSDTGVYSVNEKNRFESYFTFGFTLDPTNSDARGRVTYIDDNVDYTYAHMNYGTGLFDYGSWKNAFFMPKDCMLNYDGTVLCYLDPDDNTKKLDGTDAPIGDSSTNANVMMQWSKLWVKRTVSDSTYKFEISNKKIDSTWHCWNNYNIDGETEYFYTPKYDGFYDGTRLRSLSGKTPTVNLTRGTELSYARANGIGWCTEVAVDWLLIEDLLILMGKSTDTQSVFGGGRNNSSSALTTGTMNTKGMFWGSDDNISGVKVFGMENYWGNLWRGIAGWINAGGTQKIKMTIGTQDGSTVTDYNTDGTGYVALSSASPQGSSGGYINKCKNTDYGRFPYCASGSSSTYECDGLWFNNSQTDYACVGGDWSSGLPVGAFCVALHCTVSYADTTFGARPSYK